MQISDFMREKILDAFIDTIGNGASIALYSGTMPDIEQPIEDQVELALMPLGSPPFVRDPFENKAAINVSSFPTPEVTGTPTFFIIHSAANGAIMNGEVITGTTSSVPNKLAIEGTEIVEGEPLQALILDLRY